MLEIYEKMTHQYNRTSYEQLKDYVYRVQEKMFDRADLERERISSPEELKSYNEKMRSLFIEKMGGLDFPKVPLNPRITKTLDGGWFTAESVLFSTRPGVYATGTFYLPKGVKGPSAAVLFVCGHAHEGRMDEDYQMVCRTLVKAGLVVFALDPTGQGERSNFYDPETKEFLVNRTCPDHDTAGTPWVSTGKFLARAFLWDEMRAVDYMLTRPEVDPERLGLTGNSGGGTQTMALIAADDRIKAAAPGTFVTNRREYMYTGQAQDAEQIWPGCTEYGFDHVNPIMIFAPKPLLILAVKCDFFPYEGTLETYRVGRRFYKMLGAEQNLRLVADDDTHHYTKPLARAAAAFFTELFFGKAVDVDNSDLGLFTVEEMQTTKSGQLKGELPDHLSLVDEFRAEVRALKEARLAIPEAERKERARKWLSEQVYKNRDDQELLPRIFPKSACVQADGFMGTSCSWWTAKHLFSYGVMIKPYAENDIENKPVTLCLWDDGTKKIGDHEDFILNEIKKGRQVFVLDVPGTGAIEQRNMVLGCEYKTIYGTLFTLASDLLYAGDSFGAMHTYDVIRCLEVLRGTFGIKDEDIELYCEGSEGVFGLMAGLLCPDLTVRRGKKILSVEKDMAEPALFRYDNTLSYLVPGMLRYFDFDEL